MSSTTDKAFDMVAVELHPLALQLFDAYMKTLPKPSREIFEAVAASSCYNHTQIIKGIVASLDPASIAKYKESLGSLQQTAVEGHIILEVSQGYYRDQVDLFAKTISQGLVYLQKKKKGNDLAYVVDALGKTNPLFHEVVGDKGFAIARLEDSYFMAQLIGIIGAGAGSLFDAVKLTQSSSFLFPYQAAQITKTFPKELELIYKLH